MAPKPKRFPLPKRFNAALSEQAYANLRALNEKWGLGNNYLLVVLLENLDRVTDPDALDKAYADFIAEYGAPAPGGMEKRSG
ncbi:MAG: hypothetical protein AAGF59_03295 [Pseudomonadota bacterium]